ncbi:MAG: hypothetical protein A2V66_00560 [Ignavibacteria bacterium RBG_13_36_8]|nr:MAG: hypothetical protein A2V66_00560 [Ignavibacteria bacterium RBG_13_36_8]
MLTNKYNLLLFSLLLLTVNVLGQNTDLRKLENNAFEVGEKLTFDVKYGFITAGIAEMSVSKIQKMSGRDVYQINFSVSSVSTFDFLYKVRDRYVTYLDVEGLFPWRFEQHIREGNYTRDFSAFFDQRRGIAKTSEGSYKIPQFVHDIVSAFYYARTLDFSTLKEGILFHLENFYKDKVHPLDVIYHGKETIQVEAGTFDCIIIEPLVKEGGLFKHDGDIIIWLTDDELKIPVKVKTKIIIGSIDAELTAYEGLKGKDFSKR